MIPKRLIFIWLGNKLPSYGQFCIDSFKKTNPDFEIMLVNEIDVENTNNKDLIDCINMIESNEYNMYKHMAIRPWIKKHIATSIIGNLIAISDAFRLYLLNKYGGIYLDLDTFPVKAFDNHILSYDNGFAVNHVEKKCDYFFMGFNSKCVDNKLITYQTPYENGQIFDYLKVHRLQYKEKIVNISPFRKKQITNKFLAKTLMLGETIVPPQYIDEYYIDHFKLRAWKKMI